MDAGAHEHIVARLRAEMPTLIASLGSSHSPAYWRAVLGRLGLEIARWETPAGEATAERLRAMAGDDGGAAALVSYFPNHSSGEHVLVYVVTDGDSDVWRANVIRSADSVALGPWQPTV